MILVPKSGRFAPHAATSALMTVVWNSYLRNNHPTGVRSTAVSSHRSAVRTVYTRTVKSFSDTTLDVSLPDRPPYTTWAPPDSSAGSKANVSASGPYARVRLPKPLWGTSQEVLTNSTTLTTVRIPPIANITLVTTELVTLSPLNSTNQTKRFRLVCSVDARWDKAQHAMTESPTASLGNVGNPIYSANGSGQRSTTGIQRAALPIDQGNWTHISADAAWLDALTPSLPKVQFPSPGSNMITTFANVILAGYYKLTASSTADHTV